LAGALVGGRGQAPLPSLAAPPAPGVAPTLHRSLSSIPSMYYLFLPACTHLTTYLLSCCAHLRNNGCPGTSPTPYLFAEHYGTLHGVCPVAIRSVSTMTAFSLRFVTLQDVHSTAARCRRSVIPRRLLPSHTTCTRLYGSRAQCYSLTAPHTGELYPTILRTTARPLCMP